MPPSLDLCINDIFEPGNIPADSGIPPTVPTIPQIYDIAARFNGAGLLSAFGQLLGQPQSGAARFAGIGSLSALAALIGQRAAAQFAGTSSLSAVIAAVPPLDGLSGLTAAYSLSRELLTSFAGGTKYTTSGSNITNLNDQSGNARNLGTPGTDPVLVTAGPNSRNASDHGTGGGGRFESAAGDPLSDFITNSAGYIIVSFILDTATANSATPYQNNGIVADNGAFVGIFGKNGNSVISYNWDGNADSGSVAATMATAYVAEWRHEGGTLGLRLNGGTETTVASGNTSTLTGLITLGTGTVAAMDGKIFEVAFFNTVPSLSERDALAANFKAWIGA
jgi:hypothetical protein